MNSLYSITPGKTKRREILGKSEKLSVYYHDFFDYPLTFSDLIKWNTSRNFSPKHSEIPVTCQNGHYLLQGREGLVYKRVLRSRISAKKMEIARKASDTLSLIPSIKMIAVTGSLAMGNAGDESDIDLMVITKKGMLWTTRLLVYVSLFVFRFSLRRPMDKHQKDKLCLNLWMDEADLIWKRQDRNLYTAHEIAQILPLVNKSEAYERFLGRNAWILEFWPNSVKIRHIDKKLYPTNQIGRARLIPYQSNWPSSAYTLLTIIVEKIAFKLQKGYMKSKITREIITPTRAVFHPQDWGQVVLSRLSKSYGIF
jgi:predicted nucleotidyltransferase